MFKIERQEKLILSIIFLFFVTILLFVPIVGDDWNNYLIGQTGIVSSIKNTIEMYCTWEGRFVSRLLINLLTCHRIIYCVITAFLITALCFFIANFFKTKHKWGIYAITMIFLLTLERTMWGQSFLYVAGSITYLFPTVLVLGYFFCYFQVILKKAKRSWYDYLFSILFSFLVTMFVENIAFAYVFGNALLLFYQWYKTKRVDYFLLFNTIFSFIGAFLMLISPGNALRMMVDEQAFGQLSLLAKIRSNTMNFVCYTFLWNIPVLILFTLVLLVMIHRTVTGCFLKYALSVLLLIIMLCICGALFLKYYDLSNVGWQFLLAHHRILFLFLLALVLLFCYFFFRHVSSENKEKILFLLVLGISSNLIMMISPVWGGRTALFTVILLFMALLYLLLEITNLKQHRIYFKLSHGLGLLSIFLMMGYLFAYWQVHEFCDFRNQSIHEQLQKQSDPIIVYATPKLLLEGNDPLDEYHVMTFKKYYHIPQEVELDIQDTKWNGLLFKK